jgi:hypothetical protein
MPGLPHLANGPDIKHQVHRDVKRQPGLTRAVRREPVVSSPSHCFRSTPGAANAPARSPGPASPPMLRWALYEAGRCAARQTSPDHAYYERVAHRVGKQRAALSVARKLARRCQHRLRALGDHALAPVAGTTPWPSTRPARQSLMPCSPLPNRYCRQYLSCWTASKDRASADLPRAASITRRFASDTIPASATTVTPPSRCASRNAVMVGIIVCVSAVLPSNASTVNGQPGRVGEQPDGDLPLQMALPGEPRLAKPIRGVGLEVRPDFGQLISIR